MNFLIKWGKVGAAEHWKCSEVVGVNCRHIVKRTARWEAHMFPGSLTLQRSGFPILLLSLTSFLTTIPCSCSGRRWNRSKGQTSTAPPIWPRLTKESIMKLRITSPLLETGSCSQLCHHPYLNSHRVKTFLTPICHL